MPAPPSPRIGWVSTWNTPCGIAAYSAHLIAHLPAPVTVLACQAVETVIPDGPEVARCWSVNGHAEQGDSLAHLALAIEERGLDTLVIQWNYGFFHLEHFGRFLDEQLTAGRVVLLMLHSTVDRPHLPQGCLAPLAPMLARCQRICVHSVADCNRLKDLGLVDNVTLFPHGILDHVPPAPSPISPTGPWTIASYGFFLPHKGLLELIEAVAILCDNGEDVRLLMVNARYPAPQSGALIEQAHARVRELGLGGRVRCLTGYLAEEESLAHLAEADLIVFPYQETGESSSAAVRHGLVSGRPVAVTPLAIFEDVAPVVFPLPGCDPESLAAGLAAILKSEAAPGFRETMARAVVWRREHEFPLLSQRLHGMVLALSRRQREGRRER